jgi:capsular polysaccharide export protein
VRKANSDAFTIFKPHPDVEAGLRPGHIQTGDSDGLADRVVASVNPINLLSQIDGVWTMTSLLGSEALLRGKTVVTYGAPFYAGWGLTRDLGTPPNRRLARPDIMGLIHATLIEYPRYFDQKPACPVLSCPVLSCRSGC